MRQNLFQKGVYLTRKEKAFETYVIAIILMVFQHEIGGLAQHGLSQMRRISDVIGSSLPELREQLICSCLGCSLDETS